MDVKLPPAAAARTRPLIAGVKVRDLKVLPDERGYLMEMLRADDPDFVRFGQVYVSATYPGVVKAWHYHRTQIDCFVCIAGMVKLVLVDTRDDSPTRGLVNEFFMGVQRPLRVIVPSLVYHGWKCISSDMALVVNVPNQPYDYDEPDEFRIEPHGTLDYDWSRKDG